jgi:hypothetical protein
MADRNLSAVAGRVSIDPIETIARADRIAAAETTRPKPGLDEGPDLVEPSRPLAAQGLASKVEQAMGPIALPTLLELVDALDDVAQHANAMDDIDNGMSEIARAVLADEQAKVMRYIDLRDR